MTQQAVQRSVSKQGKLESRKYEVIGAFVNNATWSQMREMFGCTDRALNAFRERHEVEIMALRAKAAERTQEIILTTKEGRIRELHALYEDIDEWIAEHSLSERSVRYDKDGNEVGETIRFRGDAVNAKRGVIDDIAREMGERNTKGDVTVTIDNRRLVVYQNGAPE